MKFRSSTAVSAVCLAAMTISATAAETTAQPAPKKPVVTHAARFDISPAMRDVHLPPVQPMGDGSGEYEIPNKFLKPALTHPNSTVPNSPTARSPSIGTPAPAIIASFDGTNKTNSGCGCLPPDTEGDVSEDYYFQWVNTAWALYDKTTGAVIPNGVSNYTPGNSFWAGFGGLCQSHNNGDPIVVWDQFAHRWVASQFVVPPSGTNAGSAQCVAISTGSDALGTYYRYEFDSPFFGDYPKIGVWVDQGGSQDAYTLTTHEFDEANGEAFVGAAYAVLQRDAMLEGRPANQVAMVRFEGFDAYGVEPVHLIGTNTAPAGSCPVFVHFDFNTSDYLFWDMCINWNIPSSTTISANPARLAPNSPFTYDYNEVSQSGTPAVLDSFGTHVMYHATARAFPSGAPERLSLAINHTILPDVATTQGAVRWVRFGLNPQSDRIFGDNYDNSLLPDAPLPNAAAMTKIILDQGVYNPDANTRWLPAVAIDENDNIGIGYSIGGSGTNPQIGTNGRTYDDPVGTLEDEQICTPATTGHQTSSSARWGDYSNMTVDPADQCTFFFTNEYYATSSSSSWSTRVCSFKFANCGSPDFAVVNDSASRLQVCEATATADPSFNLRVGVLNGFNGAVTLSASGPAGVTPTFSNNPISPTPGASRLTLTGADALASGEYSITVTGTSSTPSSRSVAIELGVSDHTPAAPTLNTPADAATSVKIYPNFTWSAIPDALSYLVEVATDAGFTNIVASGTSATNSWSPLQPLAQSTLFYWRVTPNNYCGTGAVSAVFMFTTGVPGTCPAGKTLTPVGSWNWNDNTAQGWTVTGSGSSGTNHQWTLLAAGFAGTGLTDHAYYMADNATSSDWALVSPTVVIPAAAQSAFLQYDVYHGLEDDGIGGCWDGLIIETNSGSGFQYLPANHMFTDPYSGPSEYTGNPVWCTVSGAPAHSIVDFDSFIGQSMSFEFDLNTDGSNGPVPTISGVAVDNVVVDVCQ
jgi:hypothetical protein